MKNCPFCKNDDVTLAFFPHKLDFKTMMCCGHCNTCGAEGPPMKSEEAAMSGWDACADVQSQTTIMEDQYPGLQTIWETPDVCEACGEHLAKEWECCPCCGSKILRS